MSRSAKLTIFEGCDGTGKSTAAKEWARATNARYIHFPAMNRVGPGLSRMYVEAMLPALLGHQDVVFDRCWLSEVPYGQVFREGIDRIGDINIRMLERLALRCSTLLVRCDPGWELVKSSFLSRKGQEMLNNVIQLADVYKHYQLSNSDLPVVRYDYTKEASSFDVINSARYLRTEAHPLSWQSAGNINAKVCLVGEGFGERKDVDPFYQWPFASFSKMGCSQWLTTQLANHDIREDHLFWINADQDLTKLADCGFAKVVALGGYAAQRLVDHSVDHVHLVHPQYQKRFVSKSRYPLFDIIKGCYK